MRGLSVIALAMAACSFTPGAFPTDAAPDGPPPISVGFAKETTLADEASNVVSIRVVLSAPSDAAITVGYAITGGTAMRAVDYFADDGTLTFAPGDVEEIIEVTVGPDATEEPDETVELELQSVTGGAALAASLHTMTIAANVLPRVSFSVGTSNGPEATSPTIDVTLSTASQLQVTVGIIINGGTATSGGVDYDLSATMVTFVPGDTSEQITIDVTNDLLDEVDEQAIVALADPVNVILGTTATRSHLIEDNDLPPKVSFALAASTVSEAVGPVDLMVSLTEPSGKDITVEFSVDNTSTATVTADYTLGTTSPLSFPAGTTAKLIRVNVAQDIVLETPETVIIPFGTLTNVDLGTIDTHVLTIDDDDQTCLGTGAYLACFASTTIDVTLPVVLDTDTSTECSASPPNAGWIGQPNSCFVVARNITVTGTAVVGSRPLVLFASGSINVSGPLDASSHRGLTMGPGASAQTCTNFVTGPGNSTLGAGGGAGGTFRTKGGNGGFGNIVILPGTAPEPDAAPTTLRAGCAGQGGGKGNSAGGNNGGLPGLGGGAVYLVTGGTMTISSLIAVNGAGATAQTDPDSGHLAGGGGGGSGGMIKLHAAAFVTTGAQLMANGGGGSGGGDGNTAGPSGNDPLLTNLNNVGLGGTSANAGANGGNGFGGTNQAANGTSGGSSEGGGGGGGGGGYVVSNIALTGAQISAGDIDP